MKASRLWVITTLVASALAIFFIGGNHQRSEEPLTTPAPTVGVTEPFAEPGKSIETDPQGRKIYPFGTTVLRIPSRHNPIGGDQSGFIRLGVCFTREEFHSKCTSFENQVFITISRGNGNQLPTYPNSLQQLKREFSATDGPFDSEYDGVWEFRYQDSPRIFNYAIKEVDSTNRHVTAICSSGPRCTAWVAVDPALTVKYDFARNYLDHWPKLNKEITSFVASTIAKN